MYPLDSLKKKEAHLGVKNYDIKKRPLAVFWRVLANLLCGFLSVELVKKETNKIQNQVI